MLKNRLWIIVVMMAAIVCLHGAQAEDGVTGIPEPCSLFVYANSGCYMVCPQGDADRLDANGITISIVVKNINGETIPGIPAADIWLFGCNDPSLVLCGGGGAINADSATNAEGRTTISGQLAAGGCDSVGVRVIIQGVVAENANGVCDDGCLPIVTASPDVNGDLVVDLIDLSEFSKSYTSPPHQYLYCKDYNCDGVIDLIDFSLFSQHYLHQC
jgi:hypothetical protein